MRHVAQLIPVLAVTLLLAACGSSGTTPSSSSAQAKPAASPKSGGAAAVVKTASTDATPSGTVASLGTIKRPGGTIIQVTPASSSSGSSYGY